MPTISIIVPVYGAEQWLPRCIDSILAQTYTDFECILVDDESPDRSGAICEEYAAKDSRVKVVHQKNAGGAAARNTGLQIATGDWLMFCDNDDCLAPKTMEYALQMQENAEGALPMWWFTRRGDEFAAAENEPLSLSVCTNADLAWQPYALAYVWLHLYSAEILREHNIWFIPSLFGKPDDGEDMNFNKQYFDAKFPSGTFKILFCSNPLYYYFDNKESVTGRYETELASRAPVTYAPKTDVCSKMMAELAAQTNPFILPERWRGNFTAHYLRGFAYGVYSAKALKEPLPKGFFESDAIKDLLKRCKQSKTFNIYYIPFKFKMKRFIAKLYQWDEAKHINYYRTLEIFYRLFFRGWYR